MSMSGSESVISLHLQEVPANETLATVIAKADCDLELARGPLQVSEDVFRQTWMERLEVVRVREAAVRTREEELAQRERSLIKREKQLSLLERLAREKVARAELYLQHSKDGRSAIVAQRMAKRRKQFDYLDLDSSFSGDPGDTSLLPTTAKLTNSTSTNSQRTSSTSTNSQRTSSTSTNSQITSSTSTNSQRPRSQRVEPKVNKVEYPENRPKNKNIEKYTCTKYSQTDLQNALADKLTTCVLKPNGIDSKKASSKTSLKTTNPSETSKKKTGFFSIFKNSASVDCLMNRQSKVSNEQSSVKSAELKTSSEESRCGSSVGSVTSVWNSDNKRAAFEMLAILNAADKENDIQNGAKVVPRQQNVIERNGSRRKSMIVLRKTHGLH